jgi:threonine aldolase
MTYRKSFGSDNHSGAHPAVLAAMSEASTGDAAPYGEDQLSAGVADALRALFRAEGEVYCTLNGSGANILGLSALTRRHEAIICAESAHINTDECGSAERLLGAKLLTVPSPDGKLTPDGIAGWLSGRGWDHRSQPGVVALTQSTELGTCYTLEELRKIADFCRDSALRVYLDGARLANAAASLGCDIADIAECADVLSFGGTKNGAAVAEAVVVMRANFSEEVLYLRKQQTQLVSKMRFVACQFGALLRDDLWLANARHANAMTRRLTDAVESVPGVDIVFPVQANAIFARLAPRHVQALRERWTFGTWDEATSLVRWMTAFDTTPEDVDAFAADIKAICAQ